MPIISFPNNLIKSETQSHNLEDYYERLNVRDSGLFSPESDGQLRMWEYDKEKQGKTISLMQITEHC